MAMMTITPMMSEVAWPPDYLERWNARNRIILKLNRDFELRALLQLHYKNNLIDWIETFCVTYDPRKVDPDPKMMPIVLFKRQKEFLMCLLECYFGREDLLVEKCRDVGASWLCCYFSVWLWLYHPGAAIGWGSRTKDYVDVKGNMKAIFPKMRMIISKLPQWMLPRGFNMDTHAPLMLINNPENGASIMGEGGDNMGRGGRTSIYFKDESAHYEHPELIEAALGDNTDVQVDISSVYGSGNVFHKKRLGGVDWYPGADIPPGKTRVFVFDWMEHPGKTQAWYDRRREKAKDAGQLHLFAQEVERDYSAARENIIIPSAWVKAAIDAHIKLGIADQGISYAGQDIADGGNDKNALSIRKGVILKFSKHWGGDSGDAPGIAIPICREYGVSELYYDTGGGFGTGYKTAVNHMMETPLWPKGLRCMPWNGGGKVLDPEEHCILGDRDSPLNQDQYGNFKAQAWYRLRERFAKTYRMIHEGKVFPHDELISISSDIPVLQELVRELSQAVKKEKGGGKVIVDKNPSGTDSPNLADSVVECYNPNRVLSILDVL